MVFLSIFISTGLGAIAGFALGRAKSWLMKHEEQPKIVNLESPLLKTRLRMKGIARPNAKV